MRRICLTARKRASALAAERAVNAAGELGFGALRKPSAASRPAGALNRSFALNYEYPGLSDRLGDMFIADIGDKDVSG